MNSRWVGIVWMLHCCKILNERIFMRKSGALVGRQTVGCCVNDQAVCPERKDCLEQTMSTMCPRAVPVLRLCAVPRRIRFDSFDYFKVGPSVRPPGRRLILLQFWPSSPVRDKCNDRAVVVPEIDSTL